jgi:hypothetical protein
MDLRGNKLQTPVPAICPVALFGLTEAHFRYVFQKSENGPLPMFLLMNGWHVVPLMRSALN